MPPSHSPCRLAFHASLDICVLAWCPSTRIIYIHNGASRFMGGKTWPSNMTRHTRYCKFSYLDNDSAISKYVLQYSKLRQQKSLKILDVGCSTGWAARHMVGYLRTFGVNCIIDGLDESEKIKAEAERNLNEFYPDNLFNISIDSIYDIVICSRMLRSVDTVKQHTGISKCVSFCNNKGVIITDALPYATCKVNGYTMLTKDKAIDELKHHIDVWNGKSCLYKDCISILKRIDYKIATLSSLATRLRLFIDEIQRRRCPYCKISK